MQRPPLQFAPLAASSLQTVCGHDHCSGPSYLEMVAVGPSGQLAQHGKLRSSSSSAQGKFPSLRCAFLTGEI